MHLRRRVRATTERVRSRPPPARTRRALRAMTWRRLRSAGAKSTSGNWGGVLLPDRAAAASVNPLCRYSKLTEEQPVRDRSPPTARPGVPPSRWGRPGIRRTCARLFSARTRPSAPAPLMLCGGIRKSAPCSRDAHYSSQARARPATKRATARAQDKQAPRPAFGEEQAPNHEPAGTCVDLRTVLAGLLPTRLEVPEGPERGCERRPLDPSLFGP